MSEAPRQPLCLALDTTTRLTGICLWQGGVLELRRFAPPLTAGAQLLPAVDAMLGARDLKTADLDLVCLANGPGSFTGLRIGLATAKGLVYGGGAALLPLSTLEVLAWQAPVMDAPICPVVEARRGEVFTATYQRRAEGPVLLEAPRRVEIARLADEVPEGAWMIGPAVATQRDAFAIHGPRLALADDADCQLALPWLAQLALRRWAMAGGVDPDELEPDYLFDFTPTPGKARM